MTTRGIRRRLIVDSNNQWFVSFWVELQGRITEVRFKVDTGCKWHPPFCAGLKVAESQQKAPDDTGVPKGANIQSQFFTMQF